VRQEQVTHNRTAILDHWHKFEEPAGSMSAFSPGPIVRASLFTSVVMTATPAMAGEALDGARLPWPLALPFAGMLLSIALGPLAVKEWWHIHYAKAAGIWAVLALGGLIAVEGLRAAAAGFVHSMAVEYSPFILMLFAFYTAAGGIAVEGRLDGSAPVNTAILALGIELQNLIRELIMVFVGLASLRVTDPRLRAANGFEWEPIKEVAYLFAGIFTCIIPVIAMLEAGAKGPFSAAINALARDGTPDNAAYFWATGVLSSLLDNAPTYLVFFQLAGGDPTALTGPLAKTLTAISLGAVFMGANTYIGNAPNFMVYAIARRAGVNMPGFLPYMIWSGAILFPVFAAVTWLFLI
jgi:Na+/H+ antiporter NhaD/arsenite permease-like protein